MFAKIILPVPLHQIFDYSIPENLPALQPGMRVMVPFGHRQLIGLIWSLHSKTDFPAEQIKPIIEMIDTTPILSAQELSWCEWLARYYLCPLGEVYGTLIPNLLKKTPSKQNRSTRKKKESLSVNMDSTVLSLNPAQHSAVTKIVNSLGQFQAFLLQGVTASGKTEVYLQIIAEVLKQNKQALVLVPEIGLTPQTIARFTTRFGHICHILHSNMTDKQRYESWQAAKNGHAAIIIGTRSAIFTPFKNLGLIVIDEEHDLSYKQQDSLRYSARDFAVFRAQQENLPIVLASATPSLESLQNVIAKRYELLELPHRAGIANPPSFHLIDMRQQPFKEDISPILLKRIIQKLKQGEQVLLFLNRRGYAPMLMCHQCGWHAECTRCNKPFTCHQYIKKLICHHCESIKPLPTQCPTCKQPTVIFLGAGTEKIEEYLKLHIKDFPIIRIDRDTTRRKQAMQNFIEQIHLGLPQILIGTQMLAKGHHFPHVTLVGILDIDQGLFSSDFRSLERLGQLITQVAGRSGRAEKPGEVVIQTHQPDHPLLKLLLSEGYSHFAKVLLAERQASSLPPFTHFILWRSEATQLATTEEFLQQVKNTAFKYFPEADIRILGPIPATMEKRAGKYHFQLLFESNKRSILHQVCQKILTEIIHLPISKKVRWSIDVDPQEI